LNPNTDPDTDLWELLEALLISLRGLLEVTLTVKSGTLAGVTLCELRIGTDACLRGGSGVSI